MRDFGMNSADLLKGLSPRVVALANDIASTCPGTIEINDLLQAGMVGAVYATTNFKPGADAAEDAQRFERFAHHRIRGEMLDYVRSLPDVQPGK
jgi:RNA polymerase sigma factor for flagellar operon FliA